MKFLCALMAIVFPCLLLASPIQTDYAIFLFDHGDKNMVASMLKYAEENDKSTLENLDFRIVFMGASIDAMNKEPFSHFPEKLLHYQQLGITETIDHTWKRDRKLDSTSLNTISKNLEVQKKIWVGVSCSIFEQLLQHTQTNSNIEIVAIRDNPSPEGDTDYFRIAKEVQHAANKIAVPSKAVYNKQDTLNKDVTIIGQAPIEEWQKEAQSIDKERILDQLNLYCRINPQLPIIVYAGVYGDDYKRCFELFLDIIPNKKSQLLILPHPRYKGIVEMEAIRNRGAQAAQFKIVGEFVENPLNRITAIEALAIADIVVTADATSTIVFQANALQKKVLYVNPTFSKASQMLCDQKLIYRISNRTEFQKIIKNFRSENSSCSTEDVFELLGIPKQGAKLLWNEFLSD